MAKTGLMVPLLAPPEYKKAFAILARKKQQYMSRMVREALDRTFGEEIQAELSFLRAADHHSDYQPESE